MMPTRYTVVVVAEHTDDVIVVTPRTLDRARGREAQRLIVTQPMLTHPRTPAIIDELAPCLGQDAKSYASWCAGRARVEARRKR